MTLKREMGNWAGSGGEILPMQALDIDTSEFEALKAKGGALLTRVVELPAVVVDGTVAVARAGVAATMANAPGSSGAVLALTALPTRVLAVRLDLAAAAGVTLFDGANAANARWQVAPGEAFVPAVPLLFPAGLGIRATGLGVIPIYIQMEAGS